MLYFQLFMDNYLIMHISLAIEWIISIEIMHLKSLLQHIKNIYYLTVYIGPDSRSNWMVLAQCLLCIRTSGWGCILWRLDQGWRVSFQEAHTHGWQLGWSDGWGPPSSFSWPLVLQGRIVWTSLHCGWTLCERERKWKRQRQRH